MKLTFCLPLLLICLSPHAVFCQDSFDWEKARALHLRAQKGEKLSAEEQTVYDEARRRMQSGRGPREGKGGSNNAKPTLSGDTQPGEAAKGLVPLTELEGSYKGRDGGLYGGGANTVPEAHQKLADAVLARIQPLNAEGKPAAEGRIVLMSLGMSNTTMEFSTFMRVHGKDERIHPAVTLVDGAQGGRTAARWAEEKGQPWDTADERLKTAGVTPQQVQVLWIKQANAGPTAGDAEIAKLQDDLEKVVSQASRRYPQLKVAYLSSRIYAGYAQTRLNPEPYAYEGAFAMRGLIEKQMRGDAALNADTARGEVKAPLLLWGPYLWAAGATPRKVDALKWLPEDFSGDGTHPSRSGSEKVAGQLMQFFTTDKNAKGWFARKS